MSNHFLYGSVNEVYRTVANDLPQSWSKLIPPSTEAPLAYGSHGDPDHYSLVPLETRDGTKLLFSRCSRKKKAISPSYYVHKQLLDADMDTLFNRFDELLDTPFCSEQSFDRISADPYQPIDPDIHWSASPVQIHPEVLHGILHAMLGRWRNGSDPVIVLVPEMSAAEYNRYTSGAVRTIYSCLPASIRGKIGFMTYSAPVKQLNSVGLYFLPEKHTGNGIYLDRVTEKSGELLHSFLPESIEELLSRIASDPEHRQEELQDLWDIVESGTTLASIREEHYTSYLTHAPLLHLQTADPAQFPRLRELFYDHKGIPESLYNKLIDKLSSKIKAEDLDAPLLNRQAQDTSFRKYLTRIGESERLCTCSDSVKARTGQKIEAAFESCLSELTDIEQLSELEQYLTELTETPPACCPESVIASCSGKWRSHAAPVYLARMDKMCSDLIGQMKDTAAGKVPEAATFDQICNNEPLDLKTAFTGLEAELLNFQSQLPQRLSLEQEQKAEYLSRFCTERDTLTGTLAEQYLDAAKVELGRLLDRPNKKLPTQILTLRINLATLLSFLPQIAADFSSGKLQQFDQAKTEQWNQRSGALLAHADARLDKADNPDVQKLYDELLTIRSDLRKALSELHCALFDTKFDEDTLYKPFSSKAEEYFRKHLEYLCKPTTDPAQMTSEDRKAEQNRLEKLISFLGKHYKKETALLDNARAALSRVKKSAENSKKRKYHVDPPIPVPVSRSEEPVTAEDPSDQQEPPASNFYVPISGETPRTADPKPDADDDLDASVNFVNQNSNSRQNIQSIQVSGKPLSKILEELHDPEETSDCVQLFIGSPNHRQFEAEYARDDLSKTLEWLRKPHSDTPDFVSEAFLDSLFPIFKAAALTPEEKVSLLKTLTMNEAYHSVAMRYVDQIIGPLSNWKHDKKQTSEIRRLLQRHPKCASAHPEWLKESSSHGSVFGFLAGFPGRFRRPEEQGETVSCTAEEIKRERRSSFWTGFLAGCLCMAVVSFFLFLSLIKDIPGEVPPETTAPASTQSTTPSTESIPSVGGDSETDEDPTATTNDGSDATPDGGDSTGGDTTPDNGDNIDGDATPDNGDSTGSDTESDGEDPDSSTPTQPSRPVASIG